MVKPIVTFHGTRRDFVPSIVRQGFLMPGARNNSTGKEHGIRCGNTYGRGIYSSPSPAFALSYTGSAEDGGIRATKPSEYEGVKLVVCATVMGTVTHMTREDAWQKINNPKEGATSHIGFMDREYVVFHKAQILPCYVIHMDWGKDNWMFFDAIPADPNLWVNKMNRQHAWRKLQKEDWEKRVGPGAVQRLKDERLARARKYLGCGFGPKEGSTLVVEEIGAVDEDEEDYGEYQADRTNRVEGGESFWEFTLEEDDLWDNGRFNEYAESRKAQLC